MSPQIWFRHPPCDLDGRNGLTASVPVAPGRSIGLLTDERAGAQHHGAARTDGLTAPTAQRAGGQREPFLFLWLFWLTHIPGSILGMLLVAATLFGVFALIVIAGSTP